MKDFILIVDDAQEDLDLFQAMLEEHGYKVTKAYNGQEGLQKIKQDAPMIVISDVMMPRMNGYDLLKEIRHDTAIAKTPVLIVTARPKMAGAFLDIGADSFIAKPIHGDKFLSEVDKLVDRAKGSRLDGKKIVIFGKHERTFQDMHQKLETLGCVVADVNEEQQIIAIVEELNPDFFFLPINVETKIPVELLVHILNTWTIPTKAKESPGGKAPASSAKIRIILYEEEKEMEKIWISEAESLYYKADDNKALVQKCCKNGALGYIGVYSPQTFLSKAQQFLHQ